MADIIAYRRVRRRRQQLNNRWRLKDRENPFSMDNKDFIKHFRLSKTAVKELCDELKPHFDSTDAGYSIEMQVLSSLFFLGSGSFQRVTCKTSFSQISQTSVSRFLQKFVDAILKVLPHHINFPIENNDLMETKQDFYANTGFPNCVGAIDCTHVNITRPTEHDHFVFMNRKSRFSINVQMVCDYNLKIMDVVARWPGSSHDAFIWKNSNLRQLFVDHVPEKNFLLGDSGYPLEPWLMTPYPDENLYRERKFNKIHRSARNVIERCFGVLKSRFRCIHDTGGILSYTPEKVCKIIVTCAVLHNICIKHNILWEEIDGIVEDDDDDEENNSSYTPADLRQKAVSFREEISLNL